MATSGVDTSRHLQLHRTVCASYAVCHLRNLPPPLPGQPGSGWQYGSASCLAFGSASPTPCTLHRLCLDTVTASSRPAAAAAKRVREQKSHVLTLVANKDPETLAEDVLLAKRERNVLIDEKVGA